MRLNLIRCVAIASIVTASTLAYAQQLPQGGGYAPVHGLKKIPAMASCSHCQRKFFTPNSYCNDPTGAAQYLLGRFDVHQCKEDNPLHRSNGT